MGLTCSTEATEIPLYSIRHRFVLSMTYDRQGNDRVLLQPHTQSSPVFFSFYTMQLESFAGGHILTGQIYHEMIMHYNHTRGEVPLSAHHHSEREMKDSKAHK